MKIANNPFVERKQRISTWRDLAVVDCSLCDSIVNEARMLMQLGLKQKDASHIACALYAGADCFLTTDKKILNKSITGIQVLNPIEFIRRYFDE